MVMGVAGENKKAYEIRSIEVNNTRISWYKALGLCPVCCNVWISLLSYPLLVCVFGRILWEVKIITLMLLSIGLHLSR